MGRIIKTRLLISVFSFALCLLAGELALRTLGFKAARQPSIDWREDQNSIKMQAFAAFDPIIGWVNQPGTYHRTEAERDVESVILPEGDRRTSLTPASQGKEMSEIVFFGDSFIYGTGLNDSETLPWKLQELLPETNIINYATVGYGFCQIHLFLNRLLAEKQLHKPLVIIAVNNFFESRSVRDPRGDIALAQNSPFHSTFYPACLVQDGEISIQKPERYFFPSLAGFQSVLFKEFYTGYRYLLDYNIIKSKREAAFKLLESIDNSTREAGGELIVLYTELPAEARKAYSISLDSLGIKYIDASRPYYTAGLRLSDGHPNEELNRQVADIIGSYLSS